MKKSVIIGFGIIVLVLVVFFIGDFKGWFTTYEDIEVRDPILDADLYYSIADAEELGYLPEDNELVVEHRKQVDAIFGETWHSDNYNKAEIKVPEVEAEETVEGENWFPVINNTAPLDEIAPTISYELMLDGYKISPYYPQNPEKYTAQALNENAFPIGFFRKVNDLCYYTACKVEGGGYIYYFFCANSGVTPEEALEAAGEEMKFNSEGKMYMDKPIHLYNTELADLDSIDLTREAVWRGSVYAGEEIGTCEEFNKKITEIIKSGDWIERTPEILSKSLSKSFKPIADLQDVWADNACEFDNATKEYEYYMLQELNNQGGLLYSHHMCSDGYVFLHSSVSEMGYNGSAELKPINGINPSETLQITGTAGYDKSIMALVYHYFGLVGGTREQTMEYNNYSIEILPQDNIHNLK